ncbi:MAG: long-chain fatty acid--CoA ligase [Ruminococcaceae bacterium]|nr:long-chain fatty acid--CoA ligase [Oscillospiraceae bacterium]
MNTTIKTVKQLAHYAAEKYQSKDFCRFFRDNEMVKKSFDTFYNDSLAVCRYIRSVTKEKIHIGFIGKTSYEYIACLTGMIFSGNVVVPFAPEITVEEACELFDDADIEMLFCEEEFEEKAKEIKKSYSGLKQIVSLGDWRWFERIFDVYSSDSFYAYLSDITEKPDECSLIIYTSGTTGERKGVMLSNHNLASNSCYEAYSMDNDDISFSILPMHHVFCYACDVLKTLFDGGTLCLNGDLVRLYINILKFQPTIMRIVPSICKSMLTKIKIAERNHPELSKREAAELVVGKNFRRMIAGSAFLSGTLIDEFEKYGITARQGYGMSECSPRISTSDFSDVCKYSNGKLLGTDEVRVCDGEIQVKGPSVMLGYYKKPERTREAFTEDGFLHTGDLGYIDGEHIYLVGRKKNLIILSNGENISPEEIENCFIDDGIVKEIVVFAEGDRIIAEIFPDMLLAQSLGIDDVYGEVSNIVDRVNIRLNSDRQIHTFRLRETPFARTSTGKIKRTEFYY